MVDMEITEQGVRSVYLIGLGRTPESPDIARDRAREDAVALISGLLLSEEFRTQIVEPYLAGDELLQSRLTQPYLAEARSWARGGGRSLFDMPVGEDANWPDLLNGLIRSAAFRGDFGARSEAGQNFLAILDYNVRTARRFVGVVEEINNARCRGYVVDAANPGRPLSLVLKVNGQTAALVPALGFRRDIQDRYGGDGRVGFDIDFETIAAVQPLGSGIIDLVEERSGMALLRSVRIDFSPHLLLQTRDGMLSLLGGLKRNVEQLSARLDGHRIDYVATVAGYERNRLLARRWPPPAAEGRPAVLLDARARPVSRADVEAIAAQTRPVSAVRVAGAIGDDLLAVLRASIPDTAVAEPGSALHALLASADLVVMLKGGEILDRDACGWFAYAAGRPGAMAVFGDGEQEIDGPFGDAETVPVLRSALDPDLLYTSDEYDAPLCLSREGVELLAPDAWDAGGDLRLAAILRCLERYGRCAFRHVPVILSRSVDRGASAAYAAAREQLVGAWLERVHPGASLVPHDDRLSGPITGRHRVQWPLTDRSRIALVVPTKDAVDMVSSLVSSLKTQTRYLSLLDVLVVSNNSNATQTPLALRELQRDEIVKVVEDNDPFNWARLNDTAIRSHVAADIVVCLNNDMICSTEGWDDLLRAQLARPDVDIVGGRLLYPNGTIQHAGVVMNGAWLHEAVGDPPGHGLYRDRTRVVHECPAVTGAFLAFRRQTYLEAGGFDAVNLPIAYNDMDFCLKVEKRGGRILYDPEQIWIHFESETRGFDANDVRKRERSEAARQIVVGRQPRADYLGLNANPHFARSHRPFTMISWPDLDLILSWIDQQETRHAVPGPVSRTNPQDVVQG